MRKVTRERYRQLREAAVRAGGFRDSPLVLTRRLYGEGTYQCTSHLRFEIVPDDRMEAADVEHREHLQFRVRCRRCAGCLKARTALWRNRAQAEALAGARSWMGTFTVNDESLYVLEAQARLRLSRRSGDQLPEDRTSPTYFREVEHQGYAALVKFWKRLRKSGYQIRYFLVAEPHDSSQTADYRRGVPHWHALITQRGEVAECDQSDRCRCLPCAMRREWRLGFTDYLQIGGTPEDLLKAAAYVAKYISKLMVARIRASRAYGGQDTISSILAPTQSQHIVPPGVRENEQRDVPDPPPPPDGR